MSPSQGPTRDDRLLFSTEHGWVRHCACRNLLVLQFHGYWLAVSRPQYRDFHERLIESVRCPVGRMRLDAGGRFAFRTEDGQIAFSLDRPGMEELLWLLDSARFMLDAHDAARAGFADSGEGARIGILGEDA